MQLDKMDRRILRELQRDGAITNLELAERIGLSPSPCARRVKQLQDAGVIKGQVIVLNPLPLNLKLTALIQISMDRHTPDRFEEFEKIVASYPESNRMLIDNRPVCGLSTQSHGAGYGVLP